MLDLVGSRHGNRAGNDGHVPAVRLLRDGTGDGAEAELAVTLGGEVLVGLVLVGTDTQGQTREDANEETAEGGEAGADDGNVDLDDGPDGNVELDVTLVGRLPVVTDEALKTDATDNGRAAATVSEM